MCQGIEIDPILAKIGRSLLTVFGSQDEPNSLQSDERMACTSKLTLQYCLLYIVKHPYEGYHRDSYGSSTNYGTYIILYYARHFARPVYMQ